MTNHYSFASTGLLYVEVTPDNLPQALEVQHLIWPKNPVDKDYIAKASNPDDLTNVSWLVYRRKKLIGLTGVFTFDPDEPGYDHGESIWMDWFAVLPSRRGFGFGRNILIDTITYAAKLQRFHFFRLDTSDYPGRISTYLYDSAMDLRENYTAETMPAGHIGLIYSRSLDNTPIKPWNNQFLNLGHQHSEIIIV